jgi:hypothetical protein
MSAGYRIRRSSGGQAQACPQLHEQNRVDARQAAKTGMLVVGLSLTVKQVFMCCLNLQQLSQVRVLGCYWSQ